MGPAEENFGVNMVLICHKSSYFKAAFNGSLDEASNSIIKLSNEVLATSSSFTHKSIPNHFPRDLDGTDMLCFNYKLIEV